MKVHCTWSVLVKIEILKAPVLSPLCGRVDYLVRGASLTRPSTFNVNDILRCSVPIPQIRRCSIYRLRHQRPLTLPLSTTSAFQYRGTAHGKCRVTGIAPKGRIAADSMSRQVNSRSATTKSHGPAVQCLEPEISRLDLDTGPHGPSGRILHKKPWSSWRSKMRALNETSAVRS